MSMVFKINFFFFVGIKVFRVHQIQFEMKLIFFLNAYSKLHKYKNE